MISTKPVLAVSNSVKSGINQTGIKTVKEILQNNPTLEKDLVELAQNAPKGVTPLDVIIKQLKKIGIINKL